MDGGLGTLPYIYEMARKTGWISEEYIGKILAVSQVTPGPLACNIGAITGFKVSGIAGSFVANLGFICPAICFMSISYKLIKKIKNNKKANNVIKIVRSSALAVMISGSSSLFKNTFLEDTIIKINIPDKICKLGLFQNNTIKNSIEIYEINFKNIALATGIYIFLTWNIKESCKQNSKIKKVNSLALIVISAVIGIIVGV